MNRHIVTGLVSAAIFIVGCESAPVTSSAIENARAAVASAEADPNVGLRVYVYSGGCSGYRYGMMLEDQPTSEDVRIQAQGINVYVDAQSTALLKGSEIDYVDTLMGAGFTVNNPNAVSGCGCGSSFRTAESAGSPGGCSH